MMMMSEANQSGEGTPEHSFVQSATDADVRKFFGVQSARKPVALCLNCGFGFLQKSWYGAAICAKCKSENLSFGTATLSTAESKEANLDRAD